MWEVNWKDLETGTPIHPYAWVYQTSVKGSIRRFGRINIVELGVYDGCSARIMYESLDGNGTLTLVDPNRHKLVEEILTKPDTEFFQKKAEDVADEFETIHLLHQDTSPHTYEQHVGIHELYTNKVPVGGIMIVHDVSPTYGTYRYVNEFLAQQREWQITRIPPHKDSPTTVPIIARKIA